MTCCACNTEKQAALDNDPKLKTLVDKLAVDILAKDIEDDAYPKRKCLVAIRCKEATGPNQDGHYGTVTYYGASGVNQQEIHIFCGNTPSSGFQGCPDVTVTLYHEVQHAAEACYGPKIEDCKGAACVEARARYCSGMNKEASKAQAHLSAKSYPECAGKTEEAIKAWAQTCDLKDSDCYIMKPEPDSAGTP